MARQMPLSNELAKSSCQSGASSRHTKAHEKSTPNVRWAATALRFQLSDCLLLSQVANSVTTQFLSFYASNVLQVQNSSTPAISLSTLGCSLENEKLHAELSKFYIYPCASLRLSQRLC